MNVGDQVSAISFQATNGIHTTFERYRGSWLVLYFYPKDATPGCTLEGCDFRDSEKAFALHNANILGVSRDGLSSHEKFKAAQQFPFELVSDPEEILCQFFDVMHLKSMYGKQVRGVERSTFLIDPNGIVRHIWRKVNVKGHVDEILKELVLFQKE